MFRKMNPAQQRDLLRILKYMRTGQSIPEADRSAAQQLIRLLQLQRDQFHQQLFDELAVASDGTAEKTRLADEMFESQEMWDKKVAPSISAALQGEELTMGQLKAVMQLQNAVDPILLQQVKDRTAIGWSGDSAAWKRIWEKVTTQQPPVADRVMHIELMGQPDVYRGKAVEVEGWVRSARQEMLGADSELGLSHYFILWIRPRETKLGPFCIYTQSLPAGFPSIPESFVDINESIRVQGYFFKIRNYVAADSSVKNCPLIIAANIEEVKLQNFTSVTNWTPSRTTLTIAFILIPLIATGLAWLVFRNSRTRPYVPGKKTRSKIDKSLQALVTDPNVQTDREKIMSLYESDSKDG
jgi:hypothetical protein